MRTQADIKRRIDELERAIVRDDRESAWRRLDEHQQELYVLEWVLNSN